jgi:hypothetical protein
MMVKMAIPLTEATRIVDAVVADPELHCECVAVAGSLRRQKAEVGDLEIVAIPKVVWYGASSRRPIQIRTPHTAKSSTLMTVNAFCHRIRR